QSASFIQIKEHEKVDVITHKVVQRSAAPPKRVLVQERPKIEKKKASEKPSKTPLPPPPPRARATPGPAGTLENGCAAAGYDSDPRRSGGRLDAHPHRKRPERMGADERSLSG